MTQNQEKNQANYVRIAAVVGLVITLLGLSWYEHHQPSASPPLPDKPYHYAMEKNTPLPVPDVVQKQSTPVIATHVYTIQLMGSFDRERVQHYVKMHRLSEQAQIFAVQYHNKPWYVLGIGRYKTAEAADNAFKQLPKTLYKVGAWVRPLHLIKE